MTDILPIDNDDLRTYLEDVMFRAAVTQADIEGKGLKLLVNPYEIPEGLSQDVSDVWWIFISEAVQKGYIQVYNKKNLEEFGFI